MRRLKKRCPRTLVFKVLVYADQAVEGGVEGKPFIVVPDISYGNADGSLNPPVK
jgi:hypothetical protein